MGALRWIVTFALSVMFTATATATAKPPIVAAASSLQFALTDAAQQFEQETGERLRLNFGSSGNLQRQIAQGAPFELFLSADEANVLALVSKPGVVAGKDIVVGEGVVYATGRLVWLQRKGAGPLPSEAAPLAAINAAIAAHASGERQRIALANPEHAPYGVAAKQVLKRAKLWQGMAPLRVLGENVSQAAQFALSADARGGLVAYSLALAPALAEKSEYVLIPESWHAPLNQRMVLTQNAGETAAAFYQWLQGDKGRTILRHHGFSVPQ
jgi:molybdate transport system substrate-binding protein